MKNNQGVFTKYLIKNKISKRKYENENKIC